MNQMNVIYAANENYAKLVWISACSLFKNNKNCRIKVYLISDNITEESIRNIKKLVEEYHGELVVIDFYEVTYGLVKLHMQDYLYLILSLRINYFIWIVIRWLWGH
jgi:lipopolysaccharide biosynthesis glycosyltransferase